MTKRTLIVNTVDYWYQAAHNPQYSMAERFLYMENALNHTENVLIHELKLQGKPVIKYIFEPISEIKHG